MKVKVGESKVADQFSGGVLKMAFTLLKGWELRHKWRPTKLGLLGPANACGTPGCWGRKLGLGVQKQSRASMKSQVREKREGTLE